MTNICIANTQELPGIENCFFPHLDKQTTAIVSTLFIIQIYVMHTERLVKNGDNHARHQSPRCHSAA